MHRMAGLRIPLMAALLLGLTMSGTVGAEEPAPA